MASSKTNQILIVSGIIVVFGGVYWMQVKKDAAKTNTEYSGSSSTSVPQVKVVPEEIDKLTVKAKDKPEVVLEKKPEGWAMTSPTQTSKTDKKAIDEVLNALKGVTFKEPIAKGESNYAGYDLTADKAMHVIAAKGGTPVLDLWLGSQKSRGQMARMGNDDQVWSVTGVSAFTFDKAPKDFRDRKVWDLAKDQVVAVTLHDGKGTFEFKKNQAASADAGVDAAADAGSDASKGDAAAPAAWLGLTDGKPMSGLEANKVDDLINAFAMGGVLNADDFGDGKSDVETGLASNEATTITFQPKEGAPAKVVLGKTEGTKRYARKEGDPTIYLLAEGPSSWAEAGLDKFVTAPPTGADAGASDATIDAAKPTGTKPK